LPLANLKKKEKNQKTKPLRLLARSAKSVRFKEPSGFKAPQRTLWHQNAPLYASRQQQRHALSRLLQHIMHMYREGAYECASQISKYRAINIYIWERLTGFLQKGLGIWARKSAAAFLRAAE
jgi:hypothetical protein